MTGKLNVAFIGSAWDCGAFEHFFSAGDLFNTVSVDAARFDAQKGRIENPDAIIIGGALQMAVAVELVEFLMAEHPGVLLVNFLDVRDMTGRLKDLIHMEITPGVLTMLAPATEESIVDLVDLIRSKVAETVEV